MNWWTADEDVTLVINYVVDDEFVIPDSAAATVRGHDGSAIPALTGMVLDVSSTTTTLSIPGSENSISGSNLSETRYVSLKFVYQGETFHKTIVFKLTPFLPISVGPEDVRRQLGLTSTEMADEDIDVYAAYYSLIQDYSEVTAALTGTSPLSEAANKAIMLKAAIEATHGLEFRVGIKLKAEDSAFERMAKFNPTEMRVRLAQRMASEINIVLGVSESGTAILVTTTTTDVITAE